MDLVSIVGLTRAAVLAALYNASKPQGMGMLQYDAKSMTEQEAEDLFKKMDEIQQRPHFDYLKGRVMKVDLSCKMGEAFDPWGYDRDNGQGAAQKAIDALRATNNPDNPESRLTHETATLKAADNVKGHLREKTVVRDGVIRLGLDDVKDVLGAATDRVIQQQTTKRN